MKKIVNKEHYLWTAHAMIDEVKQSIMHSNKDLSFEEAANMENALVDIEIAHKWIMAEVRRLLKKYDSEINK